MKQAASAEADFFTVGDVAKAADASTDSVRHWERTGLLPALRTVGGRRIFRREDVTEFLAKRKRNAGHG